MNAVASSPLSPVLPVSAGAESMQALPAFPKLSRGYRMQYEQVQSAWVLLYPEGMVKLNQSAGEILRRCDGARSVAEVVADLEQAFATTGLEADVIAFLELARKQQWVEV